MNTQIINATKKSKKSKPKVILIIVDEYDSEDEPIKNLLNRKPPAKPPAEPPARRTYYFPEEVFNMIKEWAGIYDIGINWDKKWSDIQSYYSLQNYCPTISRMTQKYFRETGRDHPEIIRRAVWKDINTYIAPIPVYLETHEAWDGKMITMTRRVGSVSDKEYKCGMPNAPWLSQAEENLVNRKEKFLNSLHNLAPTFEVPKWMKVGTVIKWHGGYCNYQAGRITKITKKNITIKIFKSKQYKYVNHGQYQGGTSYYRWTESEDDETTTRSSGMRYFKESDGSMEWTFRHCEMD